MQNVVTVSEEAVSILATIDAEEKARRAVAFGQAWLKEPILPVEPRAMLRRPALAGLASLRRFPVSRSLPDEVLPSIGTNLSGSTLLLPLLLLLNLRALLRAFRIEEVSFVDDFQLSACFRRLSRSNF